MNQPDDLYTDTQFEYRPGGYIIIDGKEIAHTLQCAHCNTHWISKRGSGRVRGFCLKCNKTTCGRRACNVCIPYEKKAEREEKQWRQEQMKREVAMEKTIKAIEKQYGDLTLDFPGFTS